MKSTLFPLKRYLKLPLISVLLILLATAGFFMTSSEHVVSALNTSGWKFEPKVPENIDDPPFPEPSPPPTARPINEVMSKGSEIPLWFAYNDPDWERQAYKDYWHSSYGRWSYVPLRIHYAMHRVFASWPTAAATYDFMHNLGIREEYDSFKIPYSSSPFEDLVVVVMQTKVEKIVTLGNQVVIVGRPSPTGLQALLLPAKDFKPDNTHEALLIQLATPDGDEIDSDRIILPTQ